MIRVKVPFRNSLRLTLDNGPEVKLQDEIAAWLAAHDHVPVWIMNNPWEAFFFYDDHEADKAMMFKLAWA